MKARKWGNPMCTPEMVFECDRKIKEKRNEMRATEAGRTQFKNSLKTMW